MADQFFWGLMTVICYFAFIYSAMISQYYSSLCELCTYSETLFSVCPLLLLQTMVPSKYFFFFKTTSIRFEDEFARCLPNRSSRRLQNIFKKTLRRRLANTPWRRLQHVFTRTNVCWVGANWYKWRTGFINIKVIVIKILPNVTIFCF